MLTGLEQYSLERAGYFIRRGAVPAELASDCVGTLNGDRFWGIAMAIVERIRPTLLDLAGTQAELHSLHFKLAEEPVEWNRGNTPLFGLDAADEMALLAHDRDRAEARIAVSDDDSLLLLPGTHIAPVSQEDRAAIESRTTAEAPGQVRVRLSAGDVLCWNTNTVHRRDSTSRRGVVLAAVLRASAERCAI